MRFHILVLAVFLAVAVVQAKKAKGKGKGKPAMEESSDKGEKSGFCVSDEQMMMICHAGSPLAEKAQSAMESCAAQFNVTMEGMMDMRAKKGKGKGKGKGKPSKSKCPTFEEIMADDTYAGEICIFTELGWLDNNMVSNDALILEDIMTLPTEISEALNGEEYDQCVAEVEEAIAGEDDKCAKSYTDEEQAILMEAVNGIANIECFKGIFDEACGLYVSNAMAAMAGQGEPTTRRFRGRGFGGLFGNRGRGSFFGRFFG